MKNAQDIIAEAEQQRPLNVEAIRSAADFFHHNGGKLFGRNEAVSTIEEQLDVERDVAKKLLVELVGDSVDPVVQVPVNDERYIGVIDYREGDFWYGYTDYHDHFGRRKKGVCAACVHENNLDRDVAYAAEYEGALKDGDASWEDVESLLETHFRNEHPNVSVEDVKTGASLLSGTTIAGNTTIHTGNDSTTVIADQVDNQHAGDLSPVYDDGSTICHILDTHRFGAEGSSTTNTSYTTIGGSDLTLNPDNFRDDAGNLYIRMFAHLKHGNTDGTVYARMYRQNAASVVTGTEVSVTANDGWGVGDTGWLSLGDSGYDSYHLQLKSGDGESVSYNSVTLFMGAPQ